MKTLLTLCLSFRRVDCFAQQRKPPPPEPAARRQRAVNPAPAQPPRALASREPRPVSLACRRQPPAGGNVARAHRCHRARWIALPGTSVTATLSPAPSASAAPAASPVETKGTGNYLIDNFTKGGPIMWPILIVSIVALTVVIERVFWWGGRWFRRDPKRIEKVFTAIEVGDVAEASRLSRDSRDPVLRMMWNGLNHQHASLQGALQVAAGIEIKRAGRFLVVMDTLVTLAPLLGLLGTITGLIQIVQLSWK